MGFFSAYSSCRVAPPSLDLTVKRARSGVLVSATATQPCARAARRRNVAERSHVRSRRKREIGMEREREGGGERERERVCA